MIAGIDWNFEWSDQQIERFLELWNNRIPEKQIAKEIKRPVREIEVLKLDLAEKKKLPNQNQEINEPTEIPLNPINVEALRILFTQSSMTSDEISSALGANKFAVDRVIERERKKNPELWPKRKAGPSKSANVEIFEDKNQSSVEDFLQVGG